MYTVLIQSKKTMDSLQQFYPLISDAVEAGEIGICNWVESGTTIETAVPELYDIISRKRAWRAIVISTELEEMDCVHPTDVVNPFDFLENNDDPGYLMENGEIVNSDISLIRLTHLLGGMPAPEPSFETKILKEDGKVPKMEYHIQNNEESDILKEAYRRWNEKYTFRGMAPTEIILIKVRDAATSSDSYRRIQSSWQVHTEMDSSKFWKRNMYPHCCRFLVYDLERRGMMIQQKQLFKLWLSVLLIAKNNTDPNALQAHRLYKLDVTVNEEEMEECFQKTINKINKAKHQLEKSLKKTEDEKYRNDIPIPDYSVGVPVAFQLPKVSDIIFDVKDFQMGKREGSGDVELWEHYCNASNEELKTLLQNVDRILDHAASRVREHCSYTEDEVVPLNVYQEEDMRLSLNDVYEEIIREQEDLPSGVSEIQDRIKAADKNVRGKIIQRMTTKQALGTMLIVVISIWATLIPAVIREQSRIGLGIVLLSVMIIFPIIGLIILSSQRKELIYAAKKYQHVLSSVVSELSQNATNYSEFLSAIASHIHGSSYLDLMKKKKVKRDSSYFFRQKHLKAIEIFISKLSLWGSSFHLNLDMNSVEVADLMEEDNEIVNYDILYSLDTGKEYDVPLNEIGVDIQSPYSFVTRLLIEREEIYDNV